MSLLARSAASSFWRRGAAAKSSAARWSPSSLSNGMTASYTTHSSLPEEHRMVYDMCRKFADEELAPNATEWDKKHAFPLEAVTKLVRVWCGVLSTCRAAVLS